MSEFFFRKLFFNSVVYTQKTYNTLKTHTYYILCTNSTTRWLLQFTSTEILWEEILGQHWASDQQPSDLCLTNRDLLSIGILLIDYFAPIGSQHTRGPSRGHENHTCCHQRHNSDPEHRIGVGVQLLHLQTWATRGTLCLDIWLVPSINLKMIS